MQLQIPGGRDANANIYTRQKKKRIWNCYVYKLFSIRNPLIQRVFFDII